MSATLESTIALPRLAPGAKATVRAVTREWSALVDEHALALNASASAVLPRKELRDLRTMYTAPQSGVGSTAVKDSFRLGKFAPPVSTGRRRMDMVVYVVELGLFFVVATGLFLLAAALPLVA